MKRVMVLAAALAGTLASRLAVAQDLDQPLIVQPAIPQDLNRGRNISVNETARPEYTSSGVSLGGMALHPRVEVGAGGISNVYALPNDSKVTPFVYQRGSVELNSRWSRHALQVSASASKRQYIGESQRNEDLWSINAVGRIDVNRSLKVDANADLSQRFEDLFSGEVAPNVAALSRYRRSLGVLKGTYTQGRFRTFLSLDLANLDFLPVPLRAGNELDQSGRNRQVSRVGAQIEYARSPSVALFLQLSESRTRYDTGSSASNLNSTSTRMLSGLNVDIAGRIRGTIGLGYSIRDYESSMYRTVKGISGEVQIQAFPSKRLTISFDGQRTIEDIASGTARPSFRTRLTTGADYELLRNLILGVGGNYLYQPRSGDALGLFARGRYLANRRIGLQGAINYSQRSSNSVSVVRVTAGISYQL